MITAIEPQVTATGRYNVTQTCSLLGITRTTLGRYVKAGIIKCGFRRETGRKFFTGSELLRFWKAQY